MPRIRAQLFFCLRRRREHDEKIRHVASIKLKEYQELQLWNACERGKPFGQEIKEKRTIDKIFLCATLVNIPSFPLPFEISFSSFSIRLSFLKKGHWSRYKQMILFRLSTISTFIVQINIYLYKFHTLPTSFNFHYVTNKLWEITDHERIFFSIIQYKSRVDLKGARSSRYSDCTRSHCRF